MLAFLFLAVAFSGKAVEIHDGDTITVLDGRSRVKVRLQGIDAPEAGQPFARASREHLAGLVFGRIVRVTERSRDRYRRLVADVALPDGRLASHEMIRAGLAWWFRRYAPRDRALARLEQEARDRHRGLWSDAAPIPPWQYRRVR